MDNSFKSFVPQEFLTCHFFSNELNISFDETLYLNQVEIYSLNGILLKSENYYSNIKNVKLSLHGVNPGIYFCRIISNDRQFTQKIIINEQ